MNEYKTTDIILAACLRIKGYDMANIEIVGYKGTFIFLDVDDQIVNDYDLGRVMVEPVNFNNMIKQLTTSVRRMVRS